jgi:hypothetical protein
MNNLVVVVVVVVNKLKVNKYNTAVWNICEILPLLLLRFQKYQRCY